MENDKELETIARDHGITSSMLGNFARTMTGKNNKRELVKAYVAGMSPTKHEDRLKLCRIAAALGLALPAECNAGVPVKGVPSDFGIRGDEDDDEQVGLKEHMLSDIDNIDDDTMERVMSNNQQIEPVQDQPSRITIREYINSLDPKSELDYSNLDNVARVMYPTQNTGTPPNMNGESSPNSSKNSVSGPQSTAASSTIIHGDQSGQQIMIPPGSPPASPTSRLASAQTAGTRGKKKTPKK